MWNRNASYGGRNSYTGYSFGAYIYKPSFADKLSAHYKKRYVRELVKGNSSYLLNNLVIADPTDKDAKAKNIALNSKHGSQYYIDSHGTIKDSDKQNCSRDFDYYLDQSGYIQKLVIVARSIEQLDERLDYLFSPDFNEDVSLVEAHESKGSFFSAVNKILIYTVNQEDKSSKGEDPDQEFDVLGTKDGDEKSRVSINDFHSSDKANKKDIDFVYSILKKGISIDKTLLIPSIKPSKRISIRNFILPGKTKYFKKKEITKGNRSNISFFVDQSGSMQGSPIKNAITIACALHRIAIENPNFNVNFIMFEGEGSALVNYRDIDEEKLSHLVRTPGGSENMAEAVKDNIISVMKSDINICFTDGVISGGPIPTEILAQKGKEFIGIYANSSSESLSYLQEANEAMSKWFNRTILKTDISGLTFELLNEIRKQANS